ncbi:unnamed protein product [Paramecium pentaurelia]|uniref:Uncharacterized protein n=1 Tax=Paramecium pentaurelia TaxID=43138 RepID=A0A8S1WGK4_9CILI|nr:unnamed protein product [Paramecium pentaurelia]
MTEYYVLKKSLQTFENYGKTQEIRQQLLQGDTQVLKNIITLLIAILKDPKTDPIMMLQAVRFSKDCMETFNDDFISQFQLEVLPYFESMAMFEYKSEAHDRGQFYFSKEPDPYTAKLGNTLLHLVLECIWVWAKWFPMDPDCLKVSCYRITLEKLCILGVRFNKILYFNKLLIKRHLPECMVPMKIIQELRRAVKLDLQQTFGNGSSSIIIQQRLSQLLPQEMARDESQEVFYSDMIRRLYRQHLKNERKQVPKKSGQDESFVYMPEEKENNIQNQQMLQLNAIIQKTQSDFMSTIIQKQELQKQLREQQEKIKVMQQRIEIQDERLKYYEGERPLRSQFFQSRFVQSNNQSVQQSFIQQQQHS